MGANFGLTQIAFAATVLVPLLGFYSVSVQCCTGEVSTNLKCGRGVFVSLTPQLNARFSFEGRCVLLYWSGLVGSGVVGSGLVWSDLQATPRCWDTHSTVTQ